MSFQKIQVDEPCLSKGSIVSSIDGVYYASNNGLIRANPYQVTNIIRPICDNKTWQSLVDTSNFRAVRFNDYYLGFNVSPSTKTGGILIDTSDQRVSFIKSALSVTNIQQDLFSTNANYIVGTAVNVWDSPSTTPPNTYTWKSKKFQLPFADNLSAGKIFFDSPNGISSPPIVLTVYADDRLVLTRNVTISGDLIRLPSGFKADTYQFQVQGQGVIHSMQFGTSVKELRGA
jgi:hypothetical protein